LTAHQIAQGSDAFVRSHNQLRESKIPFPGWLAQLPIAGAYLDLWWRTNLSNPDVLVEWLRGVIIENITFWTSGLGRALLHRLLLFLITLIARLLLLRDGTWLAEWALGIAERLSRPSGRWCVITPTSSVSLSIISIPLTGPGAASARDFRQRSSSRDPCKSVRSREVSCGRLRCRSSKN
jgi:hypothetical protein